MRRLAPLLLLTACPDYGFKPIDEQPPGDTAPPGEPDLATDPAALDLGVLCESGAGTVTLKNQGEADLTIYGLSVIGSGWELSGPELPLTLAPGASEVVTVTGADGDASLLIESDDPDDPQLSVPLAATANQAPTVTIDTPIDGEVLSPGAVTIFQATVGDDVDLPETLGVSWSSDVAGVLGTNPPDRDGLASLSWDATTLASGVHAVTVQVTDSCGATAEASVNVCQNEGYVEESVDLVSWHFEGSAVWDATNGWVQLTDTGTNEAGTAFQTSGTVDASNMSIAFEFYASGGSGADGLSVTALDTTRMTTYVGTTGGGIGYGGLPGWSVEVDTWYNSEYADPTTEDHLSLILNGNVYSPIVSATLPEMEDGAWHTMSVSVLDKRMTVAVDGTTYIDQDIPVLSSFPAYVGFTAATGASTNYHLIDALEVEGYVCDE